MLYVNFYIKQRDYVIDHPLEELVLEVAVVNEHKPLPLEMHYIRMIPKMKIMI